MTLKKGLFSKYIVKTEFHLQWSLSKSQLLFTCNASETCVTCQTSNVTEQCFITSGMHTTGGTSDSVQWYSPGSKTSNKQ